jgi:hypothetical protein
MLKMQVWLKQIDLQPKLKYINLFLNFFINNQRKHPKNSKDWKN